MSELNDLLTTRELQRWRLILGEAAETTLCGLDDNARQIDHALEWLSGRDPERLQRGERSGGLGGSNLTTPEWINSIHTLFPQQVIERLESDAVLRYGIEDVQWLVVDNATAFAVPKREVAPVDNVQAPDAPVSRVLVAVARPSLRVNRAGH